MPRPLSTVVFLTVVLCLTGGIHYYLWARLVLDTAPRSRMKRLGGVAIVLLGLSLPAAVVVMRRGGADALMWVAYLWAGLMFFLFLCVLATDLVFGAILLSRPVDPERRTLLRRALGSVAALVAFATTALGVDEALRNLRVVEITVPLSRLPRALDGFVIVQLTDIHVGPTIHRDFIVGLVSRVNALGPDLVAITGDLVDGSVERLAHAVAPLADLRSPHGTFFVTGNHEYYSGAAEWVVELERLGIRVLRNERVEIERGDDGFDLAGVDDWHAEGKAPGHAADLRRALHGADPAREIVLLAHQPKQALEAAELGVGLQLSGHTHGGQMWPFTYLVRLQQPFVAGLDRLKQLYVYTSRGTGYWGPPVRVAAPAEITRITLRAA